MRVFNTPVLVERPAEIKEIVWNMWWLSLKVGKVNCSISFCCSWWCSWDHYLDASEEFVELSVELLLLQAGCSDSLLGLNCCCFRILSAIAICSNTSCFWAVLKSSIVFLCPWTVISYLISKNCFSEFGVGNMLAISLNVWVCSGVNWSSSRMVICSPSMVVLDIHSLFVFHDCSNELVVQVCEVSQWEIG